MQELATKLECQHALVQLASLDMAAQARRGDSEAVSERGRDVAMLIERVLDGRGMVSHAIAMSYCQQLALTVAELRQDYPGRYDDLLGREMERLASNVDADLLKTLNEERALAMDCFENLENGRDFTSLEAPDSYRLFSWGVVSERLEYLDTFARFQQAVATGARDKDDLAALCALDTESYPVTNTLLSYWPNFVARHGETMAKLTAL